MQQEISSSMTPTIQRMSQVTGLSDIFSSKPYSSIFFLSDRVGSSPTPIPATSTDQTGETATATAMTAVDSLSRLMSQHNDLMNRFSSCALQLQKTFKEAETLRQENTNLRVANRELSHQISLLLEAAALQTAAAAAFQTGRGGREEGIENTWKSPTSVIENETGRVSLPKSISVRSNCYLKMSFGGAAGPSGSCSEAKLKPKRGGSSRTRALSPVSGPQKVYVRKKDSPIELDVFDQGMFKTELCNKWQETGNCPCGDNCQFAHGIAELRPVIRHLHYKTEVCRMVLSGDPCPYGHRCHFRHAPTPEKQLMLPLRLE